MASIISNNPQETLELGRKLAAGLRPGEILALAGELGAGKTHFVKGLAAGLGVEDEITSPTFTLVHEHPRLVHIDFYRLEHPEEALAIGLDDYLESDRVTVIEWADKFEVLIPSQARWIRFRVLEGDQREITLS